MHYFIEEAKRPSCSGFYVPSVISQGQFLNLHLEMNAIAAIGTGTQQFADFLFIFITNHYIESNSHRSGIKWIRR